MNGVTDINLALNKATSQVSTFPNGFASKAVDGRQDTISCTLWDELHPWWSVDLGAAYDVSSVTVTNDFSAVYGNYRRTHYIRYLSITLINI